MEALWKIIDEHYCFLGYKHEAYGLDWDEVHQRYRAQVNDDMTTQQLFEVLTRSEEHTSEPSHNVASRMPSSA